MPFGAAQVGRVGRSVGGVATPRRRSAEANFAAGTEPLCLPHGRPTTPFFRPFSSFFFLFDDQRPLKKKKGNLTEFFPSFASGEMHFASMAGAFLLFYRVFTGF